MLDFERRYLSACRHPFLGKIFQFEAAGAIAHLGLLLHGLQLPQGSCHLRLLLLQLALHRRHSHGLQLQLPRQQRLLRTRLLADSAL